MKQVDKKDLPSVPGGTSVPVESDLTGTCFPPFPVPGTIEPVVPLPPTINTKL